MPCREQIESEDYAELITGGQGIGLDPSDEYCFININERFGILSLPHSSIASDEGLLYVYGYLPKVYGLMAEDFSAVSLGNTGILQAQGPPLSLNGRGVVLAFIDTGIRFAGEEFLNAAGNTRILALWDQNLSTGEPPEGYRYGTLFTREDINRALRAENPYEELPSYDEIGHGTEIASVAAGSVVNGGRAFRGAAPEADIVVVKLRQAKKNLRDFYLLPEGVPAYSENDIMLGVKFAESFAVTFERPVVICLGIGSNQGNHTTGSSLARYLNDMANIRNRGIVICGGNEGNEGHHFNAPIPSERTETGELYTDVEIRVGEGERGFLLELWGNGPDVLAVSLRTPGGESIPRFRLGTAQSQTFTFVYERARVTIDSALVEPSSGDELVAFRFADPTPGVWTVRVYAAENGGSGRFHMWLPITRFLNSDTHFLNASPYVTLTDPGIAENPITVSAYNDLNNSFYVNSGRGFLSNGLIKPDLAAPGVEVSTALGRRTGTSLSAALTAGGVAQFFQWAVVQRNYPLVQNQAVKGYFIRGADRDSGLVYPNREWGYGRLDVIGVFDTLAGL